MTNAEILSIQSYILACVRYDSAHRSEKNEMLMEMMQAQTRMHELLLTPEAPSAPQESGIEQHRDAATGR